MKRKIQCLLVVLGLCSVANARTVDIADWDFTAPDGSSISNAIDSINGYYFPDAPGVMISNNAVFVDGGSVTNINLSSVPIDPISDGKVKLTWDVLAGSTLTAGQASFAIKDTNDVLLASFRFDSADSKLRLATYYLQPNGEYTWAYTAWLGNRPDITSTLHMGMEYDVETGSLAVQWSGPYTGGKEYAVMPSSVGGVEMQTAIGKMAEGDFVFMDNLHVSYLPAPYGAQIQASATAEVSDTDLHSIASFDATNGDYVVVISASNKGTDPVESSVVISGAVDQVTYQPAISEGPGTFLWYAPVTNAGAIAISYQAFDAFTDGSHHIVGAYLIRSTTGELDPPVFASTTGSGAGEASLVYTVPSESDGVFLEAFSAYANASPQNSDTVVDLTQWSQRFVAHGTFWGLTELTNTWTTGNSAYSLAGLLFTGVQNDTPEMLMYNDWIGNYPGVGEATAMTNNPDGDRFDNLVEYAFGGDPSDPADQGYAAYQSVVNESGSNYVEYVYAKRSDADARGLTYSLELRDDLITEGWTNVGYTVEGVGADAYGPGFDAVTNLVPTVDPAKFLRVRIEFND